MRVSKRARWALVIVAAAALVLVAAAAARTHSAAKGPIVIGWVHDDSTGPMGPFDLPALAAAQLEINKVNKKGVMGRKIKLLQCVVHQPNVAASTACANKLIGEGAKIIPMASAPVSIAIITSWRSVQPQNLIRVLNALPAFALPI